MWCYNTQHEYDRLGQYEWVGKKEPYELRRFYNHDEVHSWCAPPKPASGNACVCDSTAFPICLRCGPYLTGYAAALLKIRDPSLTELLLLPEQALSRDAKVLARALAEHSPHLIPKKNKKPVQTAAVKS